MKKVLMMMLMLILTGATLLVDDGVNKQIATASWGTGGLPVQPNHEWRFASANGLDYDTTGADSSNRYRDYGQTGLTTGLTDGNRPSLCEGILQPHQDGLTFNGSTNYLQINDATKLSPGENDFGVFTWIQSISSSDMDLLCKWNGTTAQREHIMTLGAGNWGGAAGQFFAGVTEDGSFTAGHRKGKRTTAAYNDGEWHFVGFTWISDVITIYVDGAVPSVVTSYSDASVTSVFAGNTNPTIGKGLGTNYFNGSIAWVGY